MSKIELDNADLVLDDFKKVIYNTVEGKSNRCKGLLTSKRDFDVFYLATLREGISQDPRHLSHEKINTITRIIKGNVKYLKSKDVIEMLDRGMTGNIDRYLIEGLGMDFSNCLIKRIGL